MNNKQFKIFDCHLHIDKGIEGYDINLNGANVIFNRVDDYFELLANVPVDASISIVFDYKFNWDRVKEIVFKENTKAVKVHSRIQKLSNSDYPKLRECLSEIDPKIHLIYDAFYYGSELQFQPSLEQLVETIKENSERNFIVAHCGGHKILDYLFHLRAFENVYYDLSFSLSYLKNTSVYKDLEHFINVTPKDKILFGTDFPNISAKGQLECALEIFQSLGLTESETNSILYSNSKKLFLGNENTI